MNLGNYIYSIKTLDFNLFQKEFKKQDLSEIEKQQLLVLIVENDYNKKKFSFYKKAFDLIIDRRLNLNFITENIIKNPFLFTVIDFAPYSEVFDYFIERGAKLNFYSKEFEEPETCLDYIEKKIEDSIIDDLDIYFEKIVADYSNIHNDKVCINKLDYEQLINQSKFLFNLRELSILRNHIIAIGGKRFYQLKNNKLCQ